MLSTHLLPESVLRASRAVLNIAVDAEASAGRRIKVTLDQCTLGRKVSTVFPAAAASWGFPNCRTKLHRKFEYMGGEKVLPIATASEGRGFPVQSRLEDGDGIIIVDHGSRREQSNAMLHEFVKMFKEETSHRVVEAAHMVDFLHCEIADPTISSAFDRCVEQGARRIIVSPYFLFPGRHWDQDIPALVAEAAKEHPNVSYLVTAPIGLHKLMVTVVQDRMQYCLSQVAGDVLECEMCRGSGRCKQLVTGKCRPGSVA